MGFSKGVKGRGAIWWLGRELWSSGGTRRVSGMPNMMVFDRQAKKRQRARAALAPDRMEYEYLRTEVARRLVDRLEDITKEFPMAAELGAYGPQVLDNLRAVKGLSGKGGAGGVQSLTRYSAVPTTLLQQQHQPQTEASSPSARASNAEGEVSVVDVLADEEEEAQLQEGAYDLVISNLSMHWINDLPGVMAKARRALKPDGVFLASMMGGTTLTELRIAMQLAEMEREGGVSPHIAPAAHVSDCGSLLQSAGFTLPTVDVDTITVTYPDALTLMEHLQCMGESSAVLRRRTHVSRDTFLAAAAIYQELFAEPDGSVPATFQVVYMIGWSPHESQPLPKPRGSAKASLKDLDRGKGKGGGTGDS